MSVQRALALAAALLALLAPGRALAWQESHPTGDDVHVRVDPDGVASVEHTLRWHVVRGPLRRLDLVGVDPAAVIEPEVSVTADDGRTLSAHAARRDDDSRTVRIDVDEPRAAMHGTFAFDLRWRIDLAASRALTRDGGSWRLSWSGPVAGEGFDGARTVIDLPAAPDPPQPIVADTGAVDIDAVASLRREPGRDVLELVRPHVGRGESVTWTVRVDPRALPNVTDPRLRPPVNARPPREPDRVRGASLALALGALALVFGLLVRRRARAFAADCERAEGGVRAVVRSSGGAGATRALLPLPEGLRAPLAGVALAAGVGLQIAGESTWGAACIALATLGAAVRAPAVRPLARGPGRWLALRPEDAFASAGAPLGPSAPVALGLASLVAAAAVLVHRFDAQAGWLVVIDATAFVPLVVTGRASQRPPDGVHAAAPWLARLFRALQRLPALRVAPWSRPDELRLLVLPRVAMPGVVGVEVGLAWSSTPVGWAATPEVLARVLDGSAAAARLARDLPGTHVVPGRRPDERVMRLVPHALTRAAAVALVRALADALTDRRSSVQATAWTQPDRRRSRPAPSGGHPAAPAAA